MEVNIPPLTTGCLSLKSWRIHGDLQVSKGEASQWTYNDLRQRSPVCGMILHTLQGSNISPLGVAGQLIFLFYRWDMLVPRKGRFVTLWLIQWESELFVDYYSLHPPTSPTNQFFKFQVHPKKGGHRAPSSWFIHHGKRWFASKMDQSSHKKWRQTREENQPVLMPSKLPTKRMLRNPYIYAPEN